MEATAVQLLAPAKVNLSLRIERRRDDGFHELETFISPIALYDELEIQKSSTGITLNCDDPLVPQNDGNLVVRAANAFFSATGLTGGAAITLRKNIPTGAGLGGGSSDAATALQALNQLYDTHLPREALAKMAEPIGSDVPFFIFQSAALCRGRGELISPQTLSERFSLLLLKPQFGVATPFAYRRWSESREIPDFVYGSQEYHGHTFINHLERPVFEKFIFLGRIKTWLLQQPEVAVALMSGSGSTLFAVLKDAVDAQQLAQRAQTSLDPDLWTCACRTI